jgi:hypothetical protein
MNRRPPILAAAMSLLLPGLGQLVNGDRPKGLTVLCMAVATAGGAGVAALGPEALRSWLTLLLLTITYLFILVPSVLDAYQEAAGAPAQLLSGRRAWYVILMLLTIGPMSLPLLWQSPVFSRRGKIVWTIVVVLIALLFILSLVLTGPALERLLQDYPELAPLLQR